MKIRRVSPFSLPVPVYLPLIAVFSIFFTLLGTDRLLRPGAGGGGGFEGGYNFKTSPFWGGGVNFSLVRNIRGVKFYGTATAV